MASDAELLQEKLMELREENANLRISRRILMSLFNQEKAEHEQERKRLEEELCQIKGQNRRLVKRLWEQNKRIADEN